MSRSSACCTNGWTRAGIWARAGVDSGAIARPPRSPAPRTNAALVSRSAGTSGKGSRSDSSKTSLINSSSNDSKYRIAAKAIYSIGRTRLTELLGIEMPSRILSHLIIVSLDKDFRMLADNSITSLLRSEVSEVRKSAALKCVQSLPKKQLIRILRNYTSGGQSHYYNVIHWLDMGISMPKSRALFAVKQVTSRD